MKRSKQHQKCKEREEDLAGQRCRVGDQGHGPAWQPWVASVAPPQVYVVAHKVVEGAGIDRNPPFHDEGAGHSLTIANGEGRAAVGAIDGGASAWRTDDVVDKPGGRIVTTNGIGSGRNGEGAGGGVGVAIIDSRTLMVS